MPNVSIKVERKAQQVK